MSLLHAEAKAVDFQATTPGCMVEDIAVGDQIYARLYGAGYGFSAGVGQPGLPMLRGDVEIPFGADVTVELVQAEYADHTLAELGLSTIYPVQPPVPKGPGGQGTQPFSKDRDSYARDSLYPGAPVVLGEQYIVRGHRVQPVEIWPVAYNPVTSSVRLYWQITFRLRLTGSDMARTQALAKRYASPAFESRLSRQLLNYNQGRPVELSPTTAVGYLIITADAYFDAMQPFVNLKSSRGFTVTITKLSQIPGGSSNTAIKTYIQNAYDTWPIPPSYVLLVGDTDTMPGWDSVEAHEITDLYYATMDGPDDWHPDIGRGRFPVRSAAQTTIMVNKYLAYANLTGQEPWLKKAAFPATCDQYQVAEGTHNYVINTYTLPKGYTGIFPNNPQPGGDQLYCVTYNATATDIQAAANEGRWVVIYSGHGGWDGWEMNYGQDDVRNLTNTGMFPFVASHACVTGDFAQPEVFGETWVLQENKGALVFWGSSDSSYWDEDDVLERRMFDSLFALPRGHADVAEMTDDGLAGVELAYPGSAQYYWETYNVLGDPAVKIFLEPEQATFTLKVEPAAHAICATGTATSTIMIDSIGGYSQVVNLTTDPLPAGITATIDPVSAPAPFTATLTLNVTTGAPPGRQPVVITATAETTRTQAAKVDLTVDAATPSGPTLTRPTNGSSGVPLQPTFEWSPVADATSYRLQVCTDAACASPVIDVSGLTTSTYAMTTALQGNSCYFWRVDGRNSCGEGAFSPVSRFETMHLIQAFWDDMESGDSKWTHQATQGTDHWQISTAQAHSPTHAWFVPDDAGVTDSRLWTTTPFAVTGGATLTFWHRYNFEGTTYDGAVLELSTDGGNSWSDLGSHITAGGYNGTLSICCSNPLGGRQAWTGDLAAWTQVEVDLSSFAGQNVQIRWRLGCDTSSGDVGWYVDDVEVIAALPAHDFDYQPCLFVNVPAYFTATATGGYTYTWDFGGPGYGTGLDTAMPTFTYTAPGDYVVQLTQEDACANEVITHGVSVCEYSVQNLDFTLSTNPRSNAVVTFTATATGTEPIVYAWDFGDRQTGSGATVTHVYLAGGSYPVTLTASNCGGCGSVHTVHTVAICDSVHDLGIATSADPALLGQPVTFTASAQGTASIAYAWDLGDGTTGAGPSISHVYTAAGSYTVTLDAANCLDAESQVRRQVTVCDPVHDLTTALPANPRSGIYLAFTASASGALPIVYTWTFGDGGTGSGSSVTHRYAAGGSYTVTVTANNCAGVQTRVEQPLSVCDSLHDVNFTMSPFPAAVNQPVTFTASALGTAPIACTWDFGDGQVGAGFVVTHIYAAGGDYPVTLVTTNCVDAQAQVYHTVQVGEYRVYLPLAVRDAP